MKYENKCTLKLINIYTYITIICIFNHKCMCMYQYIHIF